MAIRCFENGRANQQGVSSTEQKTRAKKLDSCSLQRAKVSASSLSPHERLQFPPPKTPQRLKGGKKEFGIIET
ncbi:predicted protein [Plenodomus lingam JN3]|uniref:Predicted protein n=1 Tax=Leptosphaeria maculans (strain JN3 / isolate v23.1.3 / race Av1-4-5-6-7-8) TaxID=985895 RepID=E4ZXQ3_LEPMJ|nr:predicted protein [Plenodomus lingam JN3]CBX96148.1 predicted protein [Plenodomus lingam JN3]